MTVGSRGARVVATLLLVVGAAATAHGQGSTELQRLTLEELLNVPVETVSRTPQPLAVTPAAVEIITNEDIRWSGATSLAEALRLAPGVHVARVDGNKWAIGIRGFTDRLARSMLVLIDGRPVYSPLFAGTFWEAQDVLLQDVERIEVVRGPGGTLWGANAMTGIVNVVTKPATATQGLLLTAASGNVEPALIAGRFGGARGSRFSYRAYGKASARAPGFHASDADFDDADMFQAGARAEWTLPGNRELAIFGDVYDGRTGQRDVVTTFDPPAARTVDDEIDLGGGNIVGRWSGALGQTGGFRLQVSFDRASRQEIAFGEDRDTLDVDFQRSRALGSHELIWGAAYRRSAAEARTSGALQFFPPAHTAHVASVFVQDELPILRDRLRLSAGVKLERNNYSGVEVQPSVRLVWTPPTGDTGILSVTRAVRTPSRVERDFQTGSLVNPAVPLFVRLAPNPEFESESLVAYEAGYRRLVANLLVGASAFVNQHRRVLSVEVGSVFVEPGPAAQQILPVMFGNGLSGHSYGLELTSDLRIGAWGRLDVAYSLLRTNLTRTAGSTDSSQEARAEASAPRHQGQVHWGVTLSDRWTMDWFIRSQSRLRAPLNVPAYTRVDGRIARFIGPQLELAFAFRNLTDAHHLEFPGGSSGNVEVRRSGLAQLTWWP